MQGYQYFRGNECSKEIRCKKSDLGGELVDSKLTISKSISAGSA
jgi:hypothetical protein